MKVIIMGCGRIGQAVSRLAVKNGHDVTVIDHDANAIAQLGSDFKGKVIRGLGFDRNILLEAGIEQADAFVATSSSDNANIVAARIARMIFRVPRVVARLYDPRRAEIYLRLGLTTISSTDWGAERIYELISHTDLDVLQTFGRGEVSLIMMEVTPQMIGRTVQSLTVPGELIVTAITRQGKAFIPVSGTEFLEGDILYLTILASSMERLEEMLGLERRM